MSKKISIIAFVSFLVLGLIILVSAYPSFTQNDDFFMRASANGFFGGIYSPYLIFQNIIYGKILFFLYKHIRDYFWYENFFKFFLIFGLFIFSYSVIFSKKYKNWIFKSYFSFISNSSFFYLSCVFYLYYHCIFLGLCWLGLSYKYSRV